MSTTREVLSCRHLLDQLRPAAHFAQGLVLSTLPRGGLQVAQPANASESIVKAYVEGLHAQDSLTWQAILENQPVRLSEVVSESDAASHPYVKNVLAPLGVKYALALPLNAP